MDLATLCAAALGSVWLLPVLAVLVAADGPAPVLPTETLLMSATVVAVGERDLALVGGLFAAAVVGSVAGDLLVFGLGRSTQGLFVRSLESRCSVSGWVRRHVLHRPGSTLVGARFVPAGRLVSTAAAGRCGLALGRFLPWSLASSAAWALYMLGIGVLLGPLTGGEPLASLAAGIVMAVVTGGLVALVDRARRRRIGRARPRLLPEPALAAR